MAKSSSSESKRDVKRTPPRDQTRPRAAAPAQSLGKPSGKASAGKAAAGKATGVPGKAPASKANVAPQGVKGPSAKDAGKAPQPPTRQTGKKSAPSTNGVARADAKSSAKPSTPPPPSPKASASKSSGKPDPKPQVKSNPTAPAKSPPKSTSKQPAKVVSTAKPAAKDAKPASKPSPVAGKSAQKAGAPSKTLAKGTEKGTKGEKASASAAGKKPSGKKSTAKRGPIDLSTAKSVAAVAAASQADSSGYVLINGRRVRMISTKGLPAPKRPKAVVEKEVVKPEIHVASIKTKLSKKELDEYRTLLLTKRRQIVGTISGLEDEALRSSGGNLSNMPLHMADIGTDTFDQDFTLGMAQAERQTLTEIDAALARIENKTYGVCQLTGKPIPKARLEAKPWAKFSIEAAKLVERGVVPR